MGVSLPVLAYRGHEDHKRMLHLLFQIMGKIRMQYAPRRNHWWNVTLYVSEEGFTTGPIPYNEGMSVFSLNMDLQKHQLIVRSSEERDEIFGLSGISVADFYRQLMAALAKRQISVDIVETPFDMELTQKFSEMWDIRSYDESYAGDFWRAMLWIDSVFKEFSGRFYGKSCPVHLYWHSMDLAVTRFNGKKAEKMPDEARLSDKDAYSHECISFGFWAGDKNMQEPAFYSYTYPSPPGLEKEELKPDAAQWVMNNQSPMAILPYQAVQKAKEARGLLLDFLESAYRAGARKAGWDTAALTVPPLSEL